MSTWDDKPNDYAHALAVIERLRALLREASQYVRDAGDDEDPETQRLAGELLAKIKDARNGL